MQESSNEGTCIPEANAEEGDAENKDISQEVEADTKPALKCHRHLRNNLIRGRGSPGNRRHIRSRLCGRWKSAESRPSKVIGRTLVLVVDCLFRVGDEEVLGTIGSDRRHARQHLAKVAVNERTLNRVDSFDLGGER